MVNSSENVERERQKLLLVGHLTIALQTRTATPEPSKRRRRARSRRLRRLPFQTKGVGLRFQPATVYSNQSMTCVEHHQTTFAHSLLRALANHRAETFFVHLWNAAATIKNSDLRTSIQKTLVRNVPERFFSLVWEVIPTLFEHKHYWSILSILATGPRTPSFSGWMA
jgi:hypothetical protein